MPGGAVLDSARIVPSRVPFVRLEYLETGPGTIPENEYAQHHILLCLSEGPHALECVRDGERRALTMGHGDAMLTPAGVRVGWTWNEAVRAIVILIEPDELARFASAQIGVGLLNEQLHSVPKFSDPDLLALAEGMRGALETAKEGTPGSPVLFEALARAFLVQLVQRYGTANLDTTEGAGAPGGPAEEGTSAGGAGLTPERYRRVLNYIGGRYGERIALDDLAGEAGISPSYFTRLFRERSGQSPMQFVTAVRIERAKEQLADRDRPMITIALSCGFADQAHFSRTFKRIVGLTPKAFRAGLGTEERGNTTPASPLGEQPIDGTTEDALPRDAARGAVGPIDIGPPSQGATASADRRNAPARSTAADRASPPGADQRTGSDGAPVQPVAPNGSVGADKPGVPLERED